MVVKTGTRLSKKELNTFKEELAESKKKGLIILMNVVRESLIKAAECGTTEYRFTAPNKNAAQYILKCLREEDIEAKEAYNIIDITF